MGASGSRSGNSTSAKRPRERHYPRHCGQNDEIRDTTLSGKQVNGVHRQGSLGGLLIIWSPKIIQSDNGAEFVNQLIADLTTSMGSSTGPYRATIRAPMMLLSAKTRPLKSCSRRNSTESCTSGTTSSPASSWRAIAKCRHSRDQPPSLSCLVVLRTNSSHMGKQRPTAQWA